LRTICICIVICYTRSHTIVASNNNEIIMNKIIGGMLAVVILGGGAWFTLSPNDDHRHDDHAQEKDHNDHAELVAKEPVRADGTFSIATSFYPLEFAIGRIVGDLGEVTNVGAGRDPHDFRPSTQDILALQRADLVVLQGAEMEPWGDDVRAQLQDASVPVLIATAELDLMEAGKSHDDHGDDHKDEAAAHDEDEHHEEDKDHSDQDEHEEEKGHDDHDHGAYDPHTWLDPVLFATTIEHLTEAIVALDPDNAAAYEANAAALLAELTTLDTEYATTLANCSVDEVITSHDAFGYLGARYDFTIHSIAGISTQDLPSATTLAELREEAAEGVRAILLEENSVTAYGETLARETGLQTLSINPIAFAIPDGQDYMSLMRANLDVFATALACNE